jgi:hypothetical protein
LLDLRCRRTREHIVFNLEKHLPFNGRQVGQRHEIRSEAGVIVIGRKGGIIGRRIIDGNDREGSDNLGIGNRGAPRALKLIGVIVLEEDNRRIASCGRRNAHGNVNRGKIALVDRSWRSVIILVLRVKMRKEIQPPFS